MSSNPPPDPKADLVTLRTRRAGGTWHVGLTGDPAPSLTETDRARAEATINAALARQEERLAAFPLAWRQELPITTYREGATAFALGEEFADRLAGGRGREGAIAGLPVEISRFVVETALERAGERVAGRWRRAMVLHAMALVAVLAALAWLALSLAACRGWPRLRPGQPCTVVALHAEAANRTRHVRKALAGRSPRDTAVMFVGRLHIGPAQARAMLAEAGWDHGFALAWDWRALLAGLPRGLALARHAPRAIAAAGYRPTLPQLTAMIYRILLGTASAWCWRRAGEGVETVVFGHVGRADTILHEETMQAMGTRTVHWMHGVSTGINFQGVSDLCVVQSLHDARWHDELCHYRRNTGFVLAEPGLWQDRGTAWAVLTNFTHPAYPPFARIGPGHELALIGIIRELAARRGIDPGEVTWKPHPVFYQADPPTRQVVSDALAAAGFRLWPSERTDFEQVLRCQSIITGPSGVALDVLRHGRMPVMAEFLPIDPAHSLARFPLRGSDSATLATAFDTLAQPGREAALVSDTWRVLGPCREPTLEEVLAALRPGPD